LNEEFYHEPVLVNEILEYLLQNKDTTASRVYVDCTLGGGGYTKKILEATPESFKVIAVDRDSFAIGHSVNVLSAFGTRVIFVQDNFGNIKEILENEQVSIISGIVLDLGLSTYQLSHEDGFSYQKDTPLDMRADKSQKLTASDVLNKYSERNIAEVFYRYGELRYSRQLAKEIVAARKVKNLETTFDLVEAVKEKIPQRYLNSDLSKMFQAVRIEVNNELKNLERVLADSPLCMESGARIAAVSYHSLEDRIVKNAFRSDERLKVITKKPVEAGDDEIELNVRARSAKLRAAEKI
jgi:16S rRNA (cytosine1402-N4)-methyltransferase